MLKLAIPVVLILVVLLAWPSVEPHLERWRRSRAKRKRDDY
jgi:hypothetical protein